MPSLPPPPATAEVRQIPDVPFYSQFEDIASISWKKKSCGIASLAMIVNYYAPGTTTANRVLVQGIAAKAYIENIGWTYKGLISVARSYALVGQAFDYGTQGRAYAFSKLKSHLSEGPVMASVHYHFDPKSTIPHLVVLDGIDDTYVYYNDPAAKEGNKKILIDNFIAGWKKRFIVFRPA